MAMQIRIFRFTMFALDPSTGSENLSQVNKIDALIGHCTCAAWKNSACSISPQRPCGVGLADVDGHLSGTDSDAACAKHPRGTALCAACRSPLL